MADYGTDLAAIDDLPSTAMLASGPDNVVNALARRLLQDADALEEVGDTEPCETVNIRDWLGRRIAPGDLDAFSTRAQLCLAGDARVLSVTARVTFAGGKLVVTSSGIGQDGPFAFVLTVDGVSATLLRSNG